MFMSRFFWLVVRLLVIGSSEHAVGAEESLNGGRSILHDALLPVLRKALMGTKRSGAPIESPEKSRTCFKEATDEVLLMQNLDRVSKSIRQPPGDPVLCLRRSLRLLASSLGTLGIAAESCSDSNGSELRAVIDRLASLEADGRINDGNCPFTQKRQTTIGDQDIRPQLLKLGQGDWVTADFKPGKSSKALAKKGADAVAEKSSEAWDATKSTTAKVVDATKEGASKAADTTVDTSKSAWDVTKTGASKAVDATTNVAEKGWEKTKDATQSAVDYVGDKLKKPAGEEGATAVVVDKSVN